MTPSSVSASFTSSSLNGLIMASIFFMASYLVQDREHPRGDVAADALEVGEHVQVDLRGLDRFRQSRAEPPKMRLAQLALARAHERPLVQHLLRQRLVIGREGGDGALQILADEAMEVQDLRPARLREPAALVELLPG